MFTSVKRSGEAMTSQSLIVNDCSNPGESMSLVFGKARPMCNVYCFFVVSQCKAIDRALLG